MKIHIDIPLEQKNFIKKNFEYAFGQHSGVIDSTKDKYELLPESNLAECCI